MMEGETIICAENGRLTQSHVVASEWQTQKKTETVPRSEPRSGQEEVFVSDEHKEIDWN